LNIPEDACTQHLTVGDVTFALRTWDRDCDHRQGEALFVEYQTGGETHPFTHIPYEDDAFSWLASYLARSYWRRRISVLVEGEARTVTPGPLRPDNTLRLIGPIWCPVASVIQERPYGPGGAEKRRGTRHFQPGAKVYVNTRFGSGDRTSFEVIGRDRTSHRYVTMIFSASWLTHWRVELVYSPHVIEQIWWGHDGTYASRVYFEDWIRPFAETTA
jgi:hypothetical protein